MKPRVFVSSVVRGFEAMRQAARRGIEAAGLEPVLVNEDSPSRPDSPRNACLDEIESSDIFVLILGERGGSTAPSGKLVIEEEYEHARLKGLPILLFLQNVERDNDATRLAERASDYVDGHLRRTFQDENELEEVVREAVRAQGKLLKTRTISGDDLKTDLGDARVRHDHASLRVVLAPERDEEVIGIVRLESPELTHAVYQIGHEPAVKLFDYGAAKKAGRTEDGVIFSQDHQWGDHVVAETHLEIRPNGRLVIDRQISTLDDRGGLGGLSILEPDLRRASQSTLVFASSFYEHVDPHKRHSRFWFGAVVANRGFRLLAAEAPHGGVSMGIHSREAGPIPAEAPRLIGRSDLGNNGEVLERTLTHFRRKLSS